MTRIADEAIEARRLGKRAAFPKDSRRNSNSRRQISGPARLAAVPCPRHARFSIIIVVVRSRLLWSARGVLAGVRVPLAVRPLAEQLALRPDY